MGRNTRDVRQGIGLTCAATALAVAAYYVKWATFLEIPAFVTGVLGVWLAARAYVSNFPVGIVNVLLYAYIFWSVRLFGDMTLQFIFFGFLVHGWWSWGRRVEGPELVIRRLGKEEAGRYVVGIVLATAILIPLLARVKDSAPAVDTITTVLSFAAQLMLNRKVIENWPAWIVADLIYVPLYITRGLYATAVLYAIFLVLAVVGWKTWRLALGVRRSAES